MISGCRFGELSAKPELWGALIYAMPMTQKPAKLQGVLF